MSVQQFSEFDFFKKRLGQTERLLAVKQQQIDSLLEITRAVNNNMPITALSRIYENILHAQLGGFENCACLLMKMMIRLDVHYTR